MRQKIIETIEEKLQEKGGRDDRNYDEKPIKAKQPNRNRKEEMHYEEMENENEFIDIPASNKKVSNPEYVCEFCERFDKKF